MMCLSTMWMGVRGSVLLAVMLLLVATIGCQGEEGKVDRSPATSERATERTEPAPPANMPHVAEEMLEALRRSSGTARIDINAIIANDHIRGRVSGVASTSVGDYKVIVYVHTDQWYIHPYAGQGKNQSWAVLRSDLTWRIPTVKRAFPADEVAALLVRRSIDPPAKVSNIQIVESVAWVIIQGTGDL